MHMKRIALLVALSPLVFAVPTPVAPAPGDVFDEGALCSVGWTTDPTGLWKVMTIDLMAGPNSPMQFLTSMPPFTSLQNLSS